MGNISRDASARGTMSGKYLTFVLKGEAYALPILKVREIIGMMPITGVPRAPSCVVGVINLRGKVIAVVDLAIQLGMAPVEHSDESCIIVVRCAGQEFGLIVDEVSEVRDIADGDIQPPPQLGAGSDTEYLSGIAKSGDRIELLLDIDRALGHLTRGGFAVQ